jgi:hypothetical protein
MAEIKLTLFVVLIDLIEPFLGVFVETCVEITLA